MNTSFRNRRRPLVAVALVVALAVVAYGVWTHFHSSHGHGHGHDDHGESALSLDEGNRWATDVPLRTGMRRIRDAIAPALDGNGRPALDPEQARELAASVQENVNFLIQNCKLEPRADATLHVLITGLMEGAALLAADPKSASGASKLVEALREYPRYFEDPDWRPLP